MGRPLDEDIIIKILERWQKAFKENSHYVSASDLSLVIKDVRELPTIQPVATDTNVGNNSEIPNSSKGHWIFVHPLQEDDTGAYMCSECKVGNWEIDPESYFFCPNCGADMRGKKDG